METLLPPPGLTVWANAVLAQPTSSVAAIASGAAECLICMVSAERYLFELVFSDILFTKASPFDLVTEPKKPLKTRPFGPVHGFRVCVEQNSGLVGKCNREGVINSRWCVSKTHLEVLNDPHQPILPHKEDWPCHGGFTPVGSFRCQVIPVGWTGVVYTRKLRLIPLFSNQSQQIVPVVMPLSKHGLAKSAVCSPQTHIGSERRRPRYAR
jgi:hypothetical protein